jgi:peroxiredoxin
MAVNSALVPLGTPAPDFALPDLDDRVHTLASFTDDVLVVVFACNHCPYVQHIEKELARVVADLSAAVVAVCSNDADNYPDDGPEGLRNQADRAGWTFPYLIDADQTVARDYGAVCTPDFFVYGADRRLAYRGAFDDSTPGNGEPLDGQLLIAAVSAIGRGESVPEPHRPSMGCSIKWKVSADQ